MQPSLMNSAVRPSSHNLFIQALFDIGTCLKELHEANYVHRDIKPSNVINLPARQVCPLSPLSCTIYPSRILLGNVCSSSLPCPFLELPEYCSRTSTGLVLTSGDSSTALQQNLAIPLIGVSNHRIIGMSFLSRFGVSLTAVWQTRWGQWCQ